MKLAIARILKKEGFIADYEVLKSKPQRTIRIQLRYDDKNEPILSGLERVSKPGLRVYVGRDEIARVHGGLGIAIISTSQGCGAGRDSPRSRRPGYSYYLYLPGRNDWAASLAQRNWRRTAMPRMVKIRGDINV